mmetsp:Transcript_21894/g.28067  ORF Transcript_21894/g.28067 Transcript_21894/m.28067 type:complete len:261 (+) Transcript_21894:828-1610(+)
MSQDEILLCTKNTMGTMVHQALGNMHPAFDNTQGVLSRLRSWDSYGYQLGATLDLFDELSMANFIEVVCNIKAIELYKQQAFISEFQLECPSGLPFLVLVETYTLPCPCPNLFLPNSTKGINVPTNHNVIVKCKLIPLPRQLQLLRFCYFLALVVLFIAILSGIGIIAFRWSRFFFSLPQQYHHWHQRLYHRGPLHHPPPKGSWVSACVERTDQIWVQQHPDSSSPAPPYTLESQHYDLLTSPSDSPSPNSEPSSSSSTY